MNSSELSFTEKNYHMSIALNNPEDKHFNSQKSDVDIDENLLNYISQSDYPSKSELFILKSSRLQNLSFLKVQSKKFKSLKCSIHRNPDSHQIHQKKTQNQTSMSKKNDSAVCQTFFRESLQKNSLMNKILSQQRKANNFNYLKNSLFESLNNKQRLNSIHLKESLNVQNQKMIVLLSERPFQKKSSFGIPFKKLKIVKKFNQFSRRNSFLNQQANFADSRKKYNERRQNDEYSLMTLSQLKKVSIESLQKSNIRNDQSKKNIKFGQKEPLIQEKHFDLKDSENNKNKKSLLTISDHENDVKSSVGVSMQMIAAKKKVKTEPSEDYKSKDQFIHNHRLKKCQQKIISDLVKLQKIRNDKIVSNRNQTQLKNTKTNGLNNIHSKPLANDRYQQNSSKKSKYIIKFKTEPHQNPLQKLKTRINYQIKDDQLARKKSIKNQISQINQIHGYAKTLKRKNQTQLVQCKSQKDNKFKLEAISQKKKYLQKQLSGWDISKQADAKQNWHLNLF